MNMFRFIATLCLSLWIAVPANAGLLNKLMDSRAGDDYPLQAVPFDFSAAMESPGSIVKDYLDTYQTMDIKGTKRVIIPSFQVRFCMMDDATKTYSSSYTAGNMKFTSSSTAFAGVMLKLDASTRQKLTDLLYERFVKQLKDIGIEVVKVDPALQMAEVQTGIKETPESGAVEDLFTMVGRETKQEKKAKTSWSYPWSIHHPTQTTTLTFGGVLDGNGPGYSWARMAERPVISPSVIKVAKQMGVGVITVGYEIRLEKMEASMDKSGGFFSKPKPQVKAEPVLRTRLLGFKLMPENGDRLIMAIGMTGGQNFVGMNFDGLGIQPVASTFPVGGPKYGNYPWIELEGSYGGLRGTGTDGAWELAPDPVKLEGDLTKVMDAQYALLLHLIKQAK
ncbi:hypothetical protein [Trichlorobacter lovleyi]|uniref:hypothetical protein n=1 Tax=Trichlorobacter lovleyi TaxID=313985 RepID=UPI00248189B0|nr:hypothetical protein [Trichlorobacter lovleyi]